jgi:hypothetical protein
MCRPTSGMHQRYCITRDATVSHLLATVYYDSLEGRFPPSFAACGEWEPCTRLRGEKLNEVEKICNYFENNKSRMKYDQYLKEGYPIASGVIEGACGHLVKDRMERSGMRWKLESARSVLNIRAAFQSDYWALFQQTRIKEQTEIVHPNRSLTEGYQPLVLACSHAECRSRARKSTLLHKLRTLLPKLTN